MLRDRYVACLTEGKTPGLLRTYLIKYIGHTPPGLLVNTDAAGGELRVQVTDATGLAVKGFSFEDCTPIREDGLALPVVWKGGLATLRDRVFRLEFRLSNVRLYSFSLAREHKE